MLTKRGTQNGCVEVVAAKFMRKSTLRVTCEWQVELLQPVLAHELDCGSGQKPFSDLPAGFVVDFCREFCRGWYRRDESDYAECSAERWSRLPGGYRLGSTRIMG